MFGWKAILQERMQDREKEKDFDQAREKLLLLLKNAVDEQTALRIIEDLKDHN